MKYVSYVLFLAGSILTGDAGYAQLNKNIAGPLDSLVQQLPTSGPGGVLIIAQKGQQLYHREFGYANLEHQTPITNETVFEAASVSKQFAATAALLLIKNNQLSLEDDVRKYVPELPDYGTKITIRHLLTHTSGLKDWRNVTYLTNLPTGYRLFNQQDAIDVICRQSNLNYKPGERYSYTNAGYDLIGIIVERITKKTFRDFVKENLLNPAGMSNSNFRGKYTDIIKNIATSYAGTPGNYQVGYTIDETYGAAGLLTTADDLRKWNEFINGKAGEAVKEMRLERYVLNNGDTITYANGGVWVNHIHNIKEITHSGLIAGYRALTVFYPEYDLSISYMSNTRNIITGDLHAEVFNILFGKKYKTPLPKANTVSFQEGELKNKTGQYYSLEDLSEYLTFSVSDNVLLNYQAPLKPITKNSFIYETTVYEFSVTGDTLLLNRNGAAVTLHRATDFNPSEKELKEFTGNFYSSDVDVTLQFKITNNKLVIYRNAADSVILTPAYRRGNEFSFRGFDHGLRVVYTFTKPAKGAITDIMAHLPRANHIPFKRKK
ncbi:serine hydrolase domain-containing protein [Gynurincola endophyticus]|uniref:serine hydrolase domain-containing protein n=1 Tax=Gynurincola endophyticus TaxID=2479004 RepID=UPI000F8E5BBA|nr:serine hydrolase domain-containing protein [Gynurincola endophyticus]